MAVETEVTLRLDTVALFDALRKQVGDWRLGEHDFDASVDELRVTFDAGGSGRVGLTVVFELDAAQMSRLLEDSRPTP